VTAPKLRFLAACWPALAFYLAVWPAAASGSWVAAWLFCLSGTFLATTLYRQARSDHSRPQRQPAGPDHDGAAL